MKNLKRVIALVVAAALLAGSYGLYQRLTSSPEETGGEETVAVQRGNLVLTAAAFGSISLPQKVTLSFPTAGTVAGVEVEVGDQVTQGQVLARLDDGPLRQAVLQAQVGLKNTELALKDVKEPYSEEDIARQRDAVAEAGRAVSLAELEVPVARATGERSVADAQEALDEVQAPYSEDEMAAAREAVAEAERALQLAQQEVPIVRTTGERSVADAQEALDLELDSYGEEFDNYLEALPGFMDEGLSDEELLVDPNVYFPWVTELPKSLEDAYEVLLKVKEKLDLAQLQLDKSLQAAQNAVAKAEETLRLAQVRLSDMMPDPQEVGEAQRDLELARLQAEKSLQSARNAAAKAEESLRAARDRLAEMEAGAEPEEVGLKELQVSQARLTLEEAEANLEAARLVAPFPGAVGEVMAEAGDRVAAGAPVVVLVDPSQVEVSATVDEVDVARVKVGQPAVITLDALPGERVRGRVKSISPVAQVQSGVVSYPIVISVLGGGEAARQGMARQGGQPRRPAAAAGGMAAQIQPRGGMSASIEIVVEMQQDVLLLPSRAVRSIEGQRVVSVKAGEGVEERLVEVGLTDGRNTEITSGLHEGDTVVLPASSGTTPSPGGRGFGGGRMFR